MMIAMNKIKSTGIKNMDVEKKTRSNKV